MLGTRGQSGGFQAEMNGDSSSVPKSSAGPHYFLVVKRRDTEELNLGSTVLSESSRPQSTRWACLRVHEMSQPADLWTRKVAQWLSGECGVTANSFESFGG